MAFATVWTGVHSRQQSGQRMAESGMNDGSYAPRSLHLRLLMSTLLLVAATISFAAYFFYIVNFFYLSGAYFLDAGWYAYLVSRFEFPPSNPPSIQEVTGAPSYFAYHLSAVMPLWGALAETVRLPPSFAFAALQGSFHALLFLIGAGLADDRSNTPSSVLFSLFFGGALAFSPVALGALGYPHHEILISILFIATCYALSCDRLFFAVMAFVLMLLVREDAGFHAACFLGIYALGEWIACRRLSRSAQFAIKLAAVGFAYCCIAFVIIKIFFPQIDTFKSVYAGQGFFNHLSVGFYRERLVGVFQKRPELFVILLMPVVIGALRRDLSIFMGVGAILPWMALNLSARRGPPGELFTYYAFPFLILLAWPWLVAALRQLDVHKDGELRRGVSGKTAVLWSMLWVLATAVYFVPMDQGERVARMVSLQHLMSKFDLKVTQRVMTFVDSFSPLLAEPNIKVYVDDAMFSLLPDKARAANSLRNLMGEKNRFTAAGQPYILVYFTSYMQADDIQKSDLVRKADECFTVIGTNIRVVSSQAGDLMRTVPGSLVQEIDCMRLHS